MTKIYKTSWGRYEVVGAVETKPATVDAEGNQTAEPEYDTRCHINVQGDVPESWGLEKHPVVPYRKFDKGDTKFYRFDTLEAFREIEPEEDNNE